MNEFPISRHTRNDSSHWHGHDSEFNFNKHWKEPEKRQQLIDFGYEDPTTIKYDIDYNGFRNPLVAAPVSPYILALGCSYTFGVGLRFEETWPYLLAKKMNLALYNAGMGGSSTDYTFRMARLFIPSNKPAYVFHFITHIDRREIISDFVNGGRPYNVTGADHTDSLYRGTDLDNYYKIAISDFSSALNREKNCRAIKQICHENNALYYDTPIEDATDCFSREPDWARDLDHPGKKFQAAVADKMYNLYLQETEKTKNKA